MWTEMHCLCEQLNIDDILLRCQTHPEELSEKDDHNLTPLHLLCMASTIPLRVVEEMIRKNSTILTGKDNHGDTPLHVCLRKKNVDIKLVELLVDNSPELLEMTNKEGLMPLHIALRYNSKHDMVGDLMKFLIKNYPPALKHHVRMGYPSPLLKESLYGEQAHFIADPKFMRCVHEVELKYHDADSQIRDGAYPIHIALREGAPVEVIEALVIENPECKTYVNKFGQTPLEIASECRVEQETLNLLT